jgi:hypothetical protein
MVQHPFLPERDVIEEAECTDSLVKEGPRDVSVMRQVVLVGPDVFWPQAIGWGVKVPGKFGHAPQIAADRIRGVVPEL